MSKVKVCLNFLGFLILGMTIFLCVIFSTHPSNATSARNQQMLKLDLIDEVRSAQDLGLDYLTQPQEQLMANLLDSIRYAEEEVTQMTDNIKVAFDLGTNAPIGVGTLPDQRQLTTRTGYEAIGLISPYGRPEPFTPSLLAYMFNVEANNDGELVKTPEAQHNLIADARGIFLQVQRTPFFPLIVHKKFTDKIYLVPGVNPNAVCRDALNGVLNRTLRPLNFVPRRPRRRMRVW